MYEMCCLSFHLQEYKITIDTFLNHIFSSKVYTSVLDVLSLFFSFHECTISQHVFLGVVLPLSGVSTSVDEEDKVSLYESL